MTNILKRCQRELIKYVNLMTNQQSSKTHGKETTAGYYLKTVTVF